MRVLLVEPYLAGSHRAWAEGYARHSSHDVDLLSLPGRFWKWRMQGAALTLAEAAERVPRPDIVLATDMLHLPAFLGLARRRLGGCPVALYMHENQLTYPWPDGERKDLTYAVTNWLSMAAADAVYFNSQFHLESFFAELPRLLRHFPDASHTHRIDDVRARCSVLPVGIDLRRFDAGTDAQRAASARTGSLTVLWNQRWEYDKAPEVFFAAIDDVIELGADIRVILAGESFRQRPVEFEQACRRLGPRLVHAGFADERAYTQLLHRADAVVSTARHDFFGVAVVEAVYAGALPFLPDRLSYPELVPAHLLYRDVAHLVAGLAEAASDPEAVRQGAEARRALMARYDWGELAGAYDRALEGAR